MLFLNTTDKKNRYPISNYECKNYSSSAYFSSKEIKIAINPSTIIIKVVIKDLERVKEPAMKGDKNLNDSILDSKDTTKMAKELHFYY